MKNEKLPVDRQTRNSPESSNSGSNDARFPFGRPYSPGGLQGQRTNMRGYIDGSDGGSFSNNVLMKNKKNWPELF